VDIDFGKISQSMNQEKIISPIDIFQTLPNKDPSYSYLRDVQGIVLRKWFEEDVRINRDTIIKMNTGSGKTVVGLLILKSSIEEGFGPAVYVVPDDYLISQVEAEAQRLSISTTRDHESADYLRGRAILIINIYKLVNARSVFGLRQSDNVPIGTVLIDDVHSALATTEQQFCLKIPRGHALYTEILNLFDDSLKQQSEAKFKELKEDLEYHDMLLPFWDWQTKQSEMISLLGKYREDEIVKWNLRLLVNVLPFCKCIISTIGIEITPNSIPIDEITNFHEAKRRIFMSATLADDTPFLTHFDVNVNEAKIITPDSANDIGERLILIPQEVNPDITDEEIREHIKQIAEHRNVVVITPSFKAAKLWCANDRIVTGDNIEGAVTRLKQDSKFGLTIFAGRYDGVDLGYDACRLLVLDGLPDIRSKYDVIEEQILHGSKRIQNEFIQKVEQGMGRGVRSNSDYCAVILMGKRLVKTLYADGANEHFGTATKKQLELSDMITQQIKGKPLVDILQLLNYSFNRVPEWVTTSKESLVKVKYSSTANINSDSKVLHDAFNLARINNYSSASALLQTYSDDLINQRHKGWILMHSAEYINFENVVEAQTKLRAAKGMNKLLPKPIEGIRSQRDMKKFTTQSEIMVENIRNFGYDNNKYIIFVDVILSDLKFEKGTSKRFEEAVKNLGLLLGFYSSRPDEEDYGPDNLWAIGEGKYFVIECKNGSTNPMISMGDCEQLVIKVLSWSRTELRCRQEDITPILIHCGNTFRKDASPTDDIRIITPERLNVLKENFKSFSRALSSIGLTNVQETSRLLLAYSLTPDRFITSFTTGFTKEK